MFSNRAFCFPLGNQLISLPVDFVVCPFPHAGWVKKIHKNRTVSMGKLLECLERWIFFSPSGGIKHCRVATDKSEAESVLNVMRAKGFESLTRWTREVLTHSSGEIRMANFRMKYMKYDPPKKCVWGKKYRKGSDAEKKNLGSYNLGWHISMNSTEKDRQIADTKNGSKSDWFSQ